MYSEINFIWGNKIKDDYKQDDWDFTETHLNLGCRLRKKLELVLCQQLFFAGSDYGTFSPWDLVAPESCLLFPNTMTCKLPSWYNGIIHFFYKGRKLYQITNLVCQLASFGLVVFVWGINLPIHLYKTTFTGFYGRVKSKLYFQLGELNVHLNHGFSGLKL